MYKLKAVVIETDSRARIKLKQAMAICGSFTSPVFCRDFTEGSAVINAGSDYDVVFIAERAGPEHVAAFLEKARQSPYSKHAAYVIIQDASQKTRALVGEKVLDGIHAFLYEPYSVDDVISIARIAGQVKLSHLRAREKAAVTLVLKDSMIQIDKIALLQIRGNPVERELERLDKMCASLDKAKTLTPDLFGEAATAAFAQAPRPQSSVEYQEYGGVSRRVQAKLDEK